MQWLTTVTFLIQLLLKQLTPALIAEFFTAVLERIRAYAISTSNTVDDAIVIPLVDKIAEAFNLQLGQLEVGGPGFLATLSMLVTLVGVVGREAFATAVDAGLDVIEDSFSPASPAYFACTAIRNFLRIPDND